MVDIRRVALSVGGGGVAVAVPDDGVPAAVPVIRPALGLLCGFNEHDQPGEELRKRTRGDLGHACVYAEPLEPGRHVERARPYLGDIFGHFVTVRAARRGHLYERAVPAVLVIPDEPVDGGTLEHIFAHGLERLRQGHAREIVVHRERVEPQRLHALGKNERGDAQSRER